MTTRRKFIMTGIGVALLPTAALDIPHENIFTTIKDAATEASLFEINDATTQEHVHKTISYHLDRFVDNRRISDYAVVCDETNNTPKIIDKNELHFDVALQLTRGSEYRIWHSVIRNG